MTQSEMTFSIVKGVTDHFKAKTLDIAFFPQDLFKSDPALRAWVVLRLVGPDYTNYDGYFEAHITCNVLISTIKEEPVKDYLIHLRNIVKAQKPFDHKSMQLGSGVCLTQDSKTIIRNYGSTDNNNLVVHSIIENSYFIQQEF